MADLLDGLAPPPKPATPPSPAKDARELLKSKTCTICGGAPAPFGYGDPRRLETMKWACAAHRKLLG
jgi:hypothetical protein